MHSDLSDLRIKDTSMAEKASRIIRDKIISGEYEPGSRIREAQMAQTFGISKVCVREAMFSLIDEGLLKKVANCYTEVVKLTRQDVIDIYGLRTALEQLAVRTVMEEDRIPEQQLRDQLKVMEDMVAEGVSHARSAREDIGFHSIIIAAAGNRLVDDIWRRLSGQLTMLFNSQLRKYPFIINPDNPLQHRLLLELMLSKDIPSALQFVSEHIGRALVRSVEAVEQ